MAQIDDEIAALREAITAGVKRVLIKQGGVTKEVEYPSFDDLRNRLRWLEGQAAPTRPPVAGFAGFRRGLQ